MSSTMIQTMFGRLAASAAVEGAELNSSDTARASRRRLMFSPRVGCEDAGPSLVALGPGVGVRPGVLVERPFGQRLLPRQRGLLQPLDDVGVLVGPVLALAGVGRDVVQLSAAAIGVEQQLPFPV